MIDRLIDGIRTKKNPTVAGLDPTLDMIPEPPRLLIDKFKEYRDTGTRFYGICIVHEQDKAENNSEHVQQIGSRLILPTVTCRPVKERNKKIAEKLQPANQSSGSSVRSRRM